MSAIHLLERLGGVRQIGSGRWIARCPAHEDRRPSLSIRELDDGRLLVHCWAGCDAPDIVASLGLKLSDLFPPRDQRKHFTPPTRHAFSARDALEVLDAEAYFCELAAADMVRGITLCDDDLDRLALAAARIHAAREASHG